MSDLDSNVSFAFTPCQDVVHSTLLVHRSLQQMVIILIEREQGIPDEVNGCGAMILGKKKAVICFLGNGNPLRIHRRESFPSNLMSFLQLFFAVNNQSPSLATGV